MPHKTTICNLQVLQAGLLTTVQDVGRPHLRAWGIPVGGYLDRKAARLANALLHNQADSPVLEICMHGPAIQFSHDCQIVITGADLSARLDADSVPLYQVVVAAAGSILRFGPLKNGCRAYLGVRGQWQLAKVLDSYSPLFNGQLQRATFGRLQKGDGIAIEVPPIAEIATQVVQPLSQLAMPVKVDVLPGPEMYQYHRRQIAGFLSQTFRLSKDCNRMGLRLSGPLLRSESAVEMISSGVLPGTVQLTRSGRAIVLLADAQTTGGYPRFLQILDRDLDLLAQLKPGDQLQFNLVNTHP